MRKYHSHSLWNSAWRSRYTYEGCSLHYIWFIYYKFWTSCLYGVVGYKIAIKFVENIHMIFSSEQQAEVWFPIDQRISHYTFEADTKNRWSLE